MAITNVGFDGSVSAVQFAQLSQYQGADVPVVCGRNDFAVQANPSSTLTCTVLGGSSAGQGVLTTSSAVESVVFDAVTTPGQTRWDAVVLRRNWSSGGSASIVVVKGTAAASAPQVLPAGVDLVLDSTQDQVLALVQITYGNTVPTSVADRRLQAHKVFIARYVSALPVASDALYGMEAVVDGSRYRCDLVAGSPAWVSNSATATGVVTAATGWTVSGTTYTREGRSVHLYGAFTRTGATINGGTSGNIGNVAMGTLVSGVPRPAPGFVAAGSNAGTGPLVAVALTASGAISLAALPPNYALGAGGGLTASFSYLTND